MASLTILEALAAGLLRANGERRHYRSFRAMSEAYRAAFAGGNAEAIGAMIDFYGGAATFAFWPARVRAYAIETTPANILDCAGAYDFAPSAASPAAVNVAALVLLGATSPAAVERANELVSALLRRAELPTIVGAAHFMIATHPHEVGLLIARHIHREEEPRMQAADNLTSARRRFEGGTMIAFQSALSCSGWMLERNTIRADVQLAVARIWSERARERGAAAHIRQCAMGHDS